MTKVDVDGGKYTFVIENGIVTVQRYRQDWVRLSEHYAVGAKAIIALVCEHEEALRKIASMNEVLDKQNRLLAGQKV